MFISSPSLASESDIEDTHGDGLLNIVLNISEMYTGLFCSSSKVFHIYLYIILFLQLCVLLTISIIMNNNPKNRNINNNVRFIIINNQIIFKILFMPIFLLELIFVLI